MRYRILLFIVLLGFYSAACQQKVEHNKLAANQFQDTLKQTSEAQLIDVRTPEEFIKSHIQGATNLNIHDSDFKNQIALLDKSKPVLVYCLSGGRSEKAATYMSEQGFKKVYELTGGMMEWNAQNKPTQSSVLKPDGYSAEQFNKAIKSDTLVLVDFYAPWCAPCKQMTPWLDELKVKYENKMTLLKINADENSTLIKKLNVNALPTIILYKNGQKVWTKTGLTQKDELDKNIKNNL